jgi:hypothetical protein
MDSVGPKHRLAALYSFPKVLHEGQRLKVTVLTPGVDGHSRVGVAGIVVRADVPPEFPVGSRLTALVNGVDSAGGISLEITSETPRHIAERPLAHQAQDETLVTALVRSGLAVTERNLQTLRNGSSTRSNKAFAARLLALILDKGVSHAQAVPLRDALESAARDTADSTRTAGGIDTSGNDEQGESGVKRQSFEQINAALHEHIAQYNENADELHLFNHLKGRDGGSWVRIPLGEFWNGCSMSAELRLRFAEAGSQPVDAVLDITTPDRTWTVHWPAGGHGAVRLYADPAPSLDGQSSDFVSLQQVLGDYGLTVAAEVFPGSASDGFSDDRTMAILPHIDTTA